MKKILILFLVVSSLLFGMGKEFSFEDDWHKYYMYVSHKVFEFEYYHKEEPDIATRLFYSLLWEDDFSVFSGKTNRKSDFQYFGFNESCSQTYSLDVDYSGVWAFCPLPPKTIFLSDYSYGGIYSNIMINKRIDSEIKEIFDKNYRELVRRFLKAKELEKSRGIKDK